MPLDKWWGVPPLRRLTLCLQRNHRRNRIADRDGGQARRRGRGNEVHAGRGRCSDQFSGTFFAYDGFEHLTLGRELAGGDFRFSGGK